MSLMSTRPDGFFAQKAMDGQPGVNGSPLLMAMRNACFNYRQSMRQSYYESIGDAEEVRRQFLLGWQLKADLGNRAFLDGMLIIVEAFESWYDARRGVISLPRPGDRSIGLHCVHLTHYADSGEILGFWNNWGSGWGDHAHGMLPFKYLDKYFYEAFVTRHARFGPPLWNYASTPAPLPRQELYRRLIAEAPRERVRLRRRKGENWVLEIYETWSPTTERRVMCADVQNGFGLHVGWAFLRFEPGEPRPLMEIPELFVWPTFRRMGIGRILEGVALDYADAWNCGEIHLMMNEADAIVGPPRAAARTFALALGYEWRWRNEVAPRRPATAIKRL
jgi:GNAT superfamily N-acetyltransferase